ncbi:MAG: mismatch endonuclease, patch repair protein Vsr protein [Candidatus Nomurabacteria bacterium GW2011_GWB1_37_5]|uniref:Very short patch repair endonuclease n=1 Tax=Candidatus Nomurabacteria bacterium GW2011_GWB1_37_5 TaxID=1618742 RepID=A0A0G0K2J1_9BACT|nr:MAG: mismatch endonuclease, patch repair protein Vsr protein [Candidatus Nomurabacteria bacterium GW2011_GWB1_37_5]
MADNFTRKKRSEIMSKILSKESKIENFIGKILWSEGIRYRRNVRSMFGNPDFTIRKRKIVIFVDSCFWHGCIKHGTIPVSNRKFWKEKIERNKTRDKEVTKHYKKEKWKILRIWEHEIKKNPEKSTKKIIKYFK